MIGVLLMAVVIGLYYGIRYLRSRSKSVNTIVQDIADKVEQLHAVKEAAHIESEAHAKAVEVSKSLQGLAEKERDRAKAVAERLASLISGPF